jgi:hypothetical protein
MSGKRKARYNLRSSSNKKKFRGLTLPGYNNLGPFNEPGVPTTKSDLYSLLHDKEYEKLGKRSYWTFNQADEDYLNALENEGDYGAKAAKLYFNAKKKLAKSDPLQTTLPDAKYEAFGVEAGPFSRTRARTVEKLKRQSRVTDFMRKKKLRGSKNSLSNLQQTTQVTTMSNENGSGAGKLAQETPVDTVVDVERGIPSYQFASLPYSAVWYDKNDKQKQIDFSFRMTSVYDVVVGTQTSDVNPGTGTTNEKTLKNDSTDTIYNQPMWFKFYQGLYKYYSVVGCKWSLLIENLGYEPFWVHQMYIAGSDTPTPKATNQDMLNWPDCKSHYVEPRINFTNPQGLMTGLMPGFQRETDGQAPVPDGSGTQWPVNSQRRNTLQLSGQYTPGDANRQINLDEVVENWSLVTTNPKLREILFLRIKPENEREVGTTSSTEDGGRLLHYKYTLKLEYLVEFKELKDGLKWPVQNQPLTVLIANNTSTAEDMNDE